MAERPVELPPVEKGELMSSSFWETLVRFQRERTELETFQAKACEDMDTVRQRTGKLIEETRRVICKADELLARDDALWRKEPKVNQAARS